MQKKKKEDKYIVPFFTYLRNKASLQLMYIIFKNISIPILLPGNTRVLLYDFDLRFKT